MLVLRATELRAVQLVFHHIESCVNFFTGLCGKLQNSVYAYTTKMGFFMKKNFINILEMVHYGTLQ